MIGLRLVSLLSLALLATHKPEATSGAPTSGQEAAETETEADPVVNLELRATPDGSGLFYGQIFIGQDRQPFNLLVSTLSKRSWVPSPIFRDYFEHVYEKTSKEVDRTWAVYGNGISLVRMGLFEDQLELGGVSLGPQEFGVARYISGREIVPRFQHISGAHFLAQFGVDGLLALNIDWAWNFTHNTNPIGMLIRSGHIRQRVAALYLSAEPEADQAVGLPGGLLTFGGVNDQYFTGEIDYVPMTGHDRLSTMGWHTNVSQPVLDWSKVLASGARGEVPATVANFTRFIDTIDYDDSTELYLDSSAALFVGYVRYLDFFMVGLLGAKRLGLSGNYVFPDCRLDNKPDFVFRVGDEVKTIELRIQPKDYVIDYEHDNGHRYCLSGFITDVMNQWTLGTNFLRNYYTVLDFERQLVGFGRPPRF